MELRKLLTTPSAKNSRIAQSRYYAEIKASNDYYMDVNELNIAGYELLKLDKTEEALFVFNLNNS